MSEDEAGTAEPGDDGPVEDDPGDEVSVDDGGAAAESAAGPAAGAGRGADASGRAGGGGFGLVRIRPVEGGVGGGGGGQGQSVRRATAVMALGTTLSRVTGVLRIVALAYALGVFRLADSYNLANTLPNIVHDIVLGGILSATFVPVFVERLTTRRGDEAWEAVSAVVSVTMIVIAVASVVFVVAASFVIDATTALNHGAQAAQERDLATDLLYLFAPQLACYGFISLGTALLNARRKFGAPMFTPIANNVILIVMLVVFGTTVRHATLNDVAVNQGAILLLGLGTTAGVVAQALLMVPSLRRAGLELHWRPDFRHEAVRRIMRLSGWTFGLVVANQVALVVVLALSEKIGNGAVTAYTYAWIFFQLPYGIVAVSIMSATAPELTARWAVGDLVGFRRRMGAGLRTMLAVIIPAAAGLVILARPVVALVLGYGAASNPGDTERTAVALAMLALGLPGFCVFLYAIRVLQAVQDLRSAFWLYAFENGVNIMLAVLLAGPFGVRGIALSISIAYTVSALVALAYVRGRVQGLGGDVIGRPLGHVLLATVALVAAAVLGSNVSGSESHAALLGRVVLGTAAGLIAYVVAAGALASRGRRTPPPLPPDSEGHNGEAGPDGGPGGQSSGPFGALSGRRGRARRVPTPRPEPPPPAGRPPLRPARLGPTRSPDPGGSSPGDPPL